MNQKGFAPVIIVLIVMGVLAVGGASYFGVKQYQKSQDNKVEQENTATEKEKNLEAENAYLNSAQLPEHNTVCFPINKFLCSKGACNNIETKTAFNLVIGSSQNIDLIPRFARCDEKGCDVYDAKYEPSGIYVNVQPTDPKGFLFKMDMKELKFFEVATLGLDSYISYGYCRKIER